MSQPPNAPLINKIISKFQQGQKKESFKKLKKYLDGHPKDDVARYNYAYMCEKLNYINLAENNYSIINNNNLKNWKSRFNLYLIYINQKKYKQALKLVNEVLSINQNYQPTLRDKALILYYLKKFNNSMLCITASLKLNPSDHKALNILGLIFLSRKKYNEAKKVFKEVIKLNPKYFPSYNNLGRCYALKYDRETSNYYYKKAIKINPNFLEAINNLANNYSETGSAEKAIEYYSKALKLDPSKPEILYNIGVAYVYLNKFKKAEELYKKAYAINSNDNILKKNYSILLLRLQRYQEAWKLIDGRLETDEFKSKNNIIYNIKDKLWKGKKISKNDKILVIKEQGVGDEILYSSMYPDLLQKYHNVQIETDPRLISLFKRSFKAKDAFVPYMTYSKHKKNLKQFNVIMFAATLGALFRKNISDFPKKKFLIADKNKYKDLKKKISTLGAKYKIGISWRSKAKGLGADKSLDLKKLIPILKLNQFVFINMQYDSTNKEISDFYKNSKLKIINIDSVDLFNDFESQAALLKSLDLFISVSNSTAHISGALGVKTWVIKPKNHAAFHYWNQPGNRSPWYSNSSIKLFSYKKEWVETVQDLKDELIKKFN